MVLKSTDYFDKKHNLQYFQTYIYLLYFKYALGDTADGSESPQRLGVAESQVLCPTDVQQGTDPSLLYTQRQTFSRQYVYTTVLLTVLYRMESNRPRTPLSYTERYKYTFTCSHLFYAVTAYTDLQQGSNSTLLSYTQEKNKTFSHQHANTIH